MVIDDDGLTRFDPCCDAADFFESLEGMRVEITEPVAVSGTSRFGEIVVVADGGRNAGARTSAGGVRLRPGDPNPERLVLDDRLAGRAPGVRVGDRLEENVVGVVDYAFSTYRVQVERWPPTGSATAGRSETPSPAATPVGSEGLTIASYNVLNLDPGDDPARFASLASGIVDALGSPALLGLQEVQDDNGAEDEGVVTAGETLSRLVAAIEAAGGPRYEYAQIDPEHNADGGQPNGNIRVVWLFDPARVDIGAIERVAPASAAFAGDEGRGWEGGRKCLAAKLTAAGESLLAINCHLKSKRGDDRLFGAIQPPLFGTEEQRSAQVREVLAWVAARLDADPEARIVVLGDLNEHEFRPPMRLLAGAGLTNLMWRVPEAERYSFNFVGNSQLLDHVLVSPSLTGRVRRVEIVHLNADQPDAARASDHDPVLVEIDLR